jgi:uncharacterized membrane protein
MNLKPRRWVIFTLFSLLLIPIVVFLGGWFLAGPYEGNASVFGLMGSIYGDAIAGKSSALVLLASPMLLIFIWKSAFFLHAQITNRARATAGSQG